MCTADPAPLCSNTKLSSGTKYRIGSTSSCASSGIQWWGSCRGYPAVPHTNAALAMPAPLEHSGSKAPCLPRSQCAGWHHRPSINTSPTFFLCSQTLLSPFNFLIFLTVPYSLCRKGWTGRIRQWNTMQEDAKSVKPPPYPHTISASCSPIKLNLVTCSCVPQKLEEINSNANEKTHNLLSAEECMLH